MRHLVVEKIKLHHYSSNTRLSGVAVILDTLEVMCLLHYRYRSKNSYNKKTIKRETIDLLESKFVSTEYFNIHLINNNSDLERIIENYNCNCGDKNCNVVNIKGDFNNKVEAFSRMIFFDELSNFLNEKIDERIVRNILTFGKDKLEPIIMPIIRDKKLEILLEKK